MLRRGAWTGGVIAALAALVFVALPMIASTRLVRDRIALEINNLSGYRVAIGETTIEIFPSLRAVLTDVSFFQPGQAEGEPAVDAERMEIGLWALPALQGDAIFTSARLVRPTLHLDRASTEALLAALPAGGRLQDAIGRARAAVTANPSAPDPEAMPSDRFGSVEFEDGRIVARASGGGHEILSDLTGKLVWPELDRPASLTMTGVWRGEVVALDARSSAPMMLVAGASGPLSFTLKSEPAAVQFDGTAILGANPYVEGKSSFSTPSLRRILEWLAGETAGEEAAGPFSISSLTSANPQRLRFEEAQLTWNGSPARGVLDVTLDGPRPQVSGTLAFETLDLGAFLAAFAPLQHDGNDADAGFGDRLALDLRLSAQKALAGTVSLTDVAATARLSEDLAAFDISDATAFNGTIQSGLRIDRGPGGTQSEIRMLATDVNGAALAAAAGLNGLMPDGIGTVSLSLKGPGSNLSSILDEATGTMSASFRTGTIAGVDLDKFLARTRQGGFFPLDEIPGIALPIGALMLEASVTNGVATIRKAYAESGRYRISVSGIVPYVGRGLALSGLITPKDPNTQDPAGETDFFVGGSWSRPFISPVGPTRP